MSIQDKLEQLKKSFEEGLPKLANMDELLQFKAKFVGKSGGLSEVLKGLNDATP